MHTQQLMRTYYFLSTKAKDLRNALKHYHVVTDIQKEVIEETKSLPENSDSPLNLDENDRIYDVSRNVKAQTMLPKRKPPSGKNVKPSMIGKKTPVKESSATFVCRNSSPLKGKSNPMTHTIDRMSCSPQTRPKQRKSSINSTHYSKPVTPSIMNGLLKMKRCAAGKAK
jgi:hypothetical protein